MTRTWTWLAAAALACGLVGGLQPSQAAETGMQRLQWQNRPLVVFAPDRTDARFRRQLAIAERHADGFAERDMVVIAVVGAEPVGVDGKPAKDLANATLRQRYRVPAGAFAAILVGKDGTEKLRRGEAIAAETLFATIDAMPMRRREMRQDGAAD